MSQLNRIPCPFIFQGQMNANEQWIGSLSPLKNTLFYVGDTTEAYDIDKPILIQSDAKGLLYPIVDSPESGKTTQSASPDEKLKCAPVPLHFVGEPELYANGQSFTKIPVGAVSYLANGSEINWQKLLQESLIKHAGSSGWADYKVKLEKIPFSSLRSPIRWDQKDGKNDDDYREWYQASLKAGLGHVYGYIIPTVRAVFFATTINSRNIEYVNINIPGLAGDQNPILGDSIGGLTIYILEGDEERLKKGMYEITVKLNSDAVNPEDWHESITKNYSYTIKEMVSFEIKNELGSFGLVMIDPISVEEALLTQFPKEFGHLLKVASEQQTNNKFSPASTPSKGFNDYVLRWSAQKKAAEFAHSYGTFSLDNINLVKTGAGFTDSLFSAMSLGRDHPIRQFSKTVEAGGNAVIAWKAVAEAAEELTAVPDAAAPAATVRGKIFEKYIKLADYSDSKVQDAYKKTIAYKLTERLNINQTSEIREARLLKTFKFVDRVGKSLAIVNTVMNTVKTAEQAKQLHSVTFPALDTAKYNFQSSISQYVTLTQVASQSHPSIIFGIEFEYAKSIIKPEYHARCNELAAEVNRYVEANENVAEVNRVVLNFVIAGHTCDIGSDDDNQTLSIDRATAVKDYLLNSAAVPVSSDVTKVVLEVVGYGEKAPREPNSSAGNRSLNRRVELTHSSLDIINPAPSREGINSLERYRHTSILKEIKADEDTVALVQGGMNMAMGALLFTPAGPAVALGMAIWELGKVGVGAATSLIAFVDNVANDSLMAQAASEKKQLLHLLKHSAANIELIEDYNDLLETEDEHLKEYMEQFRLRSEAISGLVYLLILAAAGSRIDDEEDYENQCVNRYRIKEYIQNYILNDQWTFSGQSKFAQEFQLDTLLWDRARSGFISAKNGGTTPSAGRNGNRRRSRRRNHLVTHHYNLGLYWAQVCSTKDKKSLKFWGLDENYRLLPADDNSYNYEKIYGTCLPILHKATPAGYIKTNFQRMFPLHQIGTSKFFDFAKNFRASWGDLRKDNYHFVGIFRMEIDVYEAPLVLRPTEDHEQDDDAETDSFSFTDFNIFDSEPDKQAKTKIEIKKTSWKRVNPKPYSVKRHGRNSRKSWDTSEVVKHNTPISIVVILDEKVKMHLPISAKVIREDVGFAGVSQINGPSYEEIARELTAEDFEDFPELRNREDLWKGKYGCIIKPFYQHGMNRIDGLKPMVGSTGLSIIESFSSSKKALRYYRSGNLSLMDYQIDVTLAKVGHSTLRAPIWGEIKGDVNNLENLQQTIYTDLEIKGPPEKASLLNKEFLLSESSSEKSRTLFKVFHRIHPFIRFYNESGETTPFTTGGSTRDLLKYSFARMKNKPGLKMGADRFEGFDWETPLDFGVAITVEDRHLFINTFEEIGQNWKTLSCSVELANNSIGLDEAGPKLDGSLIYFGKIEIEGSQYYLSLDKNLDDKFLSFLYGYCDRDPSNNKRLKFKSVKDARSLIGFEDNVGAHLNKDLHFFMASFSVSYESPKGVSINSLRPFGPKPLWGSFEYYLRNFSTVGKGDVTGEIGPDSDAQKVFHFNQPKDNDYTTALAPWAKRNDKLDLSQYPKDSPEYKFLSKDFLEKHELKTWMEDQATELHFSKLRALAIDTTK